MFTPDTLTGQVVKQIRASHKMSRAAFSELVGFSGRSTARLSNIEQRESWKPGDRELIATALNKLMPNFDPRYHAGGGTVPVVAPSIDDNEEQPPILIAFTDDEPEDTIVDVLPADPVQVNETLQRVTGAPTTTIDLGMPAPSTDGQLTTDGLYGISNSELQTWKRCRRKWWLSFYRQLALQTETFLDARSIGIRVHRALQHWYVPEGQPRVDPRDALERVVVEDWTRIASLAKKRNVSEEQLAGLAQEFGKATNLERAMVEGYVQWLEETGADADLRIIASEQALEANVTTTVNGEERPFKFIGKLDVRARRVTDDVRLFMDHKTVGDLKGPAVTLPQNEQMLQYMLLEFLNTPDGEQRCDGALYNMLKRTKRTARATPPFYDRIEVRHNKFELDSYRRRALAASANILDAIDRLDRGDDHIEVAFPTPKSDCRFDCDFFAVCNLFDDGSPGVNDMLRVLYHEVDPRARYQEEKSKEV